MFWSCGSDSSEEVAESIDHWAEYYVRATSPRWIGERTEHPEVTTRPSARQWLRSELLPLSVHGDEDVDETQLMTALEALEHAAQLLSKTEWPDLVPDSGLGGTPGFDLYLSGTSPVDAGGFSDGPVGWTFLDTASTFGVMDSRTAAPRIAACATQAYVDARLMSLDPAEAKSWRRATSSWLTWMLTGSFGCSQSVVWEQEHPRLSPIRSASFDEPDPGEGGALFVTYLSQRHDFGSGRFIRDMWQMSRQRTWNATTGLRASPDLWEAIGVATDSVEDPISGQIEPYAVGRWFTAAREQQSPTAHALFRRIPDEGTITEYPVIRQDQLPRHSPPVDVEPFGSAYIWIDLEGADRDRSLRVWFRGEFGVAWSFQAVRVGQEHGAETLSAAMRDVHGRAFTIVDLLPDTEGVLIVATNLSHRPLDADEPDDNVRGFKAAISYADQLSP